VSDVENGEGKYFQEILDQILGYETITREDFIEILENMRGKKLSTNEFFTLLKIIESKRQSS
jgi:ribonucleotide reductase beta subunit family protein with ferritin-like domain